MRRLIHFSGAGISAESGINTFRGATGLWEDHDIDVVCNFQTWEKNIDAVHRFYDTRRVELQTVEPNPAHRLVAEMAEIMPVITVTQNIDDLFQRAGVQDVLHLHGFLTRMRCVDCDDVWDIGYTEYDRKGCRNHKCGSDRVKPDVVFFGESAPGYARLDRILDSLTDEDLVVVVGTSSRVVDIDAMLKGRPGSKVLVDTTGRYFEDEIYHLTLACSAVEAVPTLREIVPITPPS